MSAEEVPESHQPDDQITDFMRPFQEQLDQLTNELREAEEQTQTAGWRRSYETANKLHARGLKDKIVAHLKQYPHALWDEEKGTVTLA
jgi:hypothetical protein